MTPKDSQVIRSMQRFGGNFIKHLAATFQAADPINRARLRQAFADEWEEYGELWRRFHQDRRPDAMKDEP